MFKVLAGKISDLVSDARTKSPWLLHYNCGSCNGCDIELVACLTPMYDVERFGIVHMGNPRHADLLVVTGPVNHRNQRVLANIYEQMAEPKIVVAIGACACSGGIFADCYNVVGGADKVIPVDVYVPGCAVKPEAIIDGVVLALGKLKENKGSHTEPVYVEVGAGEGCAAMPAVDEQPLEEVKVSVGE